MPSVRRLRASLGLLLVLGACSSSGSDGFTQPAPTSVPPAIAFVDEEPASLAFAEDLETLVSEAGLWTEVASNEDLFNCINDAADSDADSVEELQDDIQAIGEGGWLIVADCLTGA